MKLDKRINVEYVDEDISKFLEEQSKKFFLSELNSLEYKIIVLKILKNIPNI